MVYTKHSQKSSDTVDPDKGRNIAILKGSLWDDWLGVVRAEERTNFLNGLVRAGVGTNDVENFISKQERFRRGEGILGLGEYEVASITDRGRGKWF